MTNTENRANNLRKKKVGNINARKYFIIKNNICGGNI